MNQHSRDKLIIAGNWKMNHAPLATREFFSKIAPVWSPKYEDRVRSYLFPPTISLPCALECRGKLPFTIGAQTAHWQPQGAFTGETSGPMLKELGINLVLIGHSERRQFFGETDESVKNRVQGLLAQGFEVMVCVGETRAEREAGLTKSVILRQTAAALPEINGKLSIAYEPVWAIGTGLSAQPTEAIEAHQLIRGYLREKLGEENARRTPILYGGSVTPENINTYIGAPDIDGCLIGGASLKPDGFIKMVDQAWQVKK